ncbi:YSIRK-type signal peptide-containing protein [Gemella sp.]
MQLSKGNKIVKYSIRKLSLGVAPIVVGTLIFGNYIPANVAKAGEINFKYVDENELSENEKLQIREGIPQTSIYFSYFSSYKFFL